MEKINLENLAYDDSPKVIKEFGDIKVFGINKGNFEIITRTLNDLFEKMKESEITEKEALNLQVKFIKATFPVFTNVDIGKMTTTQIKKTVENPSPDLGNALAFMYRYFGDFLKDLSQFYEKITEMPKKDYDALQVGKSEEELFEVFLRNGFIEDEFSNSFANKYLM